MHFCERSYITLAQVEHSRILAAHIICCADMNLKEIDSVLVPCWARIRGVSGAGSEETRTGKYVGTMKPFYDSDSSHNMMEEATVGARTSCYTLWTSPMPLLVSQ